MNITYVAWPVLSVHFLQQSVLTKVNIGSNGKKKRKVVWVGLKKGGKLGRLFVTRPDPSFPP